MTDVFQSAPGSATFRSPLLMNSDDSAVVVIDVQQKLLPLVPGHQRIQWNIERLIEGARILGVAACGTEQYPKGLGPTVTAIADPLASIAMEPIASKTMFSCRQCSELFTKLSNSGVHNLLLCGIETHVCVAQTAFDLMAQGFNIFLCVDSVGSRSPEDHDVAVRRMENCGVTITTTEAALFEWCEQAGSERFKSISKLVQQAGPEAG